MSSIFDNLPNPAAPAQAFMAGLDHGREQRDERELRGALADYAMNPDDPNAFRTIAQVKPQLAITIRADQTKRTQAAAQADLQRRAAAGDKQARAQLAGIDLDAWGKLGDVEKETAKQRVEFIGQAALAIKQLPPAERPAAWDSYVQQGVQAGYDDLAALQGRFSEASLDGAIAQAGMVKDALGLAEPKYQAIPEGGTLVNTKDPAAVTAFAQGQSGAPAAPKSKADFDALPPGATFIAPDGTTRRKPGGPTPQASGTFQPVGVNAAGITSTYRTPAHNAKVGGVRNSYHTRLGVNGEPLAVDSVPPKGMTMNAYAAELRRRNPGLQVINEGDHVHIEPRG